MRLHGVAQLIDALNGRVGRRVKADAVIRAGDVVVDRAGETDDGDAVFRQGQRAAERAVAADGDNAVQPEELAGADGLLLALLRAEFLAAGGVEDRAAAVDDMCHAALVQTDNVAVDQTVPAAADAYDLDAAVNGGADNGTNGRIHTGGVAAAREHADALHCIFLGFTHTITTSLPLTRHELSPLFYRIFQKAAIGKFLRLSKSRQKDHPVSEAAPAGASYIRRRRGQPRPHGRWCSKCGSRPCGRGRGLPRAAGSCGARW